MDPTQPSRVRQLRLVVEADDYDAAERTDALTGAGARLVAPPTETPWRSLNARLDAPAGLHITLFQELDRPETQA